MTEKKPQGHFIDISAEVFGKYQHCTLAKDGMWYAESDYYAGRIGKGALPSPHQDTPELIAKARAMHERAAEKITAKALRGAQPRPWWKFWSGRKP